MANQYKVNFPRLPHNFNRIETIRSLRQLCPGLGLKEAKDMTEDLRTHVLTLGYVDQPASAFALETLRANGVILELIQTAGATSSTTVSEIRKVAEAAVGRGEYDIALALIDVLKRFS